MPLPPLRAALAAAVCAAALAVPASAQERVEATLAGHAWLPAFSLIPAPADAPAFLQTSGKFTAQDRRRIDRPVSSQFTVPAPQSGPALRAPFVGQPVQGFSGIRALGGGEFLLLTDNGFGGQANSPDAMLMFHRAAIDWASGEVRILATTFLSDPDRVIPFRIAMEGTDRRWLTGADLDPESIQPVGDRFWIGDEFGPYLIVVDGDGVVREFHETRIGDRLIRAPEHYALSMPSNPGAVAFELPRSRGYEGMAVSPDARTLYPMFEGPLWDAQAGAPETDDGGAFLRIAEYDVAQRRFTGRTFRYRLEDPRHAIGDFNMVDADTALVIERDNDQGDPALACPEGQRRPDCFAGPVARFKRVYRIELAGVADGGHVRKAAYADLMDIADPRGLARLGGRDGRLAFPFVTIENVDVVDAEHVVVGNDNNFPFSSGRAPGVSDHNEFVLLRVPGLLASD